MAVGMLRSLKIANRAWRFPADIEVTFWPGGLHNSEYMDDNLGGTAKVKNTTGKLTGITTRAAENDELEDLVDMVKGTVETPTPCVFSFADGSKWSGSSKAVISEDGPFASTDGKFTFDLYAANSTGEFVKV